jgi:glycosyltransferase involved in cell wall biosynthesis
VRPLRLAIVTRRFWPLVGGPEKVLANLAGELFRRGLAVTILTAQWQPTWPSELRFQDVPVYRFSPPPQDRWTTIQYMRSLALWLRSRLDGLDLVYVSQLRHEAYSALRAVRGALPVVLRAEHVGRYGDCLWQIDAPCGRRIKRECVKAAAFAAPTIAAQRELEAAGYPRQRIKYVPNGVPIPPPRTPQSQAAARAVLAETHPALVLPERAFLAVCIDRFQSGEALDKLLAAWGPIVRNLPHARLWLAGPATEPSAIQSRIDAAKLTGRVIWTGVFDRVDELLAAADLLVAPAPAGSPVALTEAMAAGLPIVAVDGAANRSVLTDGQQGLLVAGNDAAALLTAIARLYKEPDLAVRLGNAARARAEAEFSLARMADQHVTWFEQLVRK